MKNLRYCLIALFALAPGLASAQGPDSINVIVADVIYPGYGALFGPQFDENVDIGPLPLVATEPAIGCVEGGCAEPDANGFCPAVDNPEEIEGNIAFISRGECNFTTKIKGAAAAGAVAVVVYNNNPADPADPNGLTSMSGDCTPEQGCSIPSLFVSYNSGQALITEVEFGAEATLDPIRITIPPPVLSTGVIDFQIHGQGFIGANPSFAGEGFVFNGTNGLFVSSLLLGMDGNVVTNPYDGVSEFEAVTGPVVISPPFPPPFEDFDLGATSSYSSADLGVLATTRAYLQSGDPYAIVEFEIENTSGADLNDLYIGVFADWDAGTTSVDDQAGVNEELNLLYVYDGVEDVPYFGVAALGEGVSLSGYNADATTADDAQLYEALTTAVEPGGDPAERGTVIGIGPYDIPADASVTVRFAYVGGATEAELFTNVEAAQAEVIVSTEQVTPLGTYVLESAYPNPFSSRTTIGFELPTAQDVTLTVYDVLGREVAVLVDGMRQAGPQTVEFDAASLPSGTYIYRLEAGSTQLMERLTVVR